MTNKLIPQIKFKIKNKQKLIKINKLRIFKNNKALKKKKHKKLNN